MMAIISQNRTLIPLCNHSSSPFKIRKNHIHPLLKLYPHLNNNMNPYNPTLTNRRVTAVSASSLTPNRTTIDTVLPFQQDTTAFTSTNWSEFAKNVSGEWDGYGADFSIEGKPYELPENVVPEAFREWEVKVFDWQTQCPTLAEPDDFTAKYKLIKLLPTVGCEADAATRHSIDERNIGGDNSTVSAFAYQSSGCYVAVWQIEDRGAHRILELEHCLVDPQNKESRVRVIQTVRVENEKLVLKSIKVFAEQWYGPFRNGEQLGGCAIRDSTFAATEALKSSEVSGIWQVVNAVASFQYSRSKIVEQVVDDKVQNLVRDEGLIMLPKKLWCSLKEREDGETCCEVGWLLDQGCAITSKCIFSTNAELKEIATARETSAAAQ